jgi:hypothetical protein
MTVARGAIAVCVSLVTLVLLAGQAFALSYAQFPPLEHAIIAGSWLCAAATAVYFFRSTSAWEAQMACPACGQRGTLTRSALRRARVSLLALLFFGIIPVLLYSHSRKQHFTCGNCHRISDVRTVGGLVALLWFVFLIVSLVAVLALAGANKIFFQ